MNFAAMTRWTEEEIPCPKCGQKKRIKKYQVINASEKPHLKEKILKNEVFFFQCENCKLSAPLTYPSLYLDSKKRLAISLSPEIEGENKTSPGDLKEFSGYKKRIVDNINDLKEKIMIWENRLDDRVIELVKIEYLRQLEKEMKDDTLMNILFDYSGHNMYLMVFFAKKGIGRIPLVHDFYRQIETQYSGRLNKGEKSNFEKIDMEWAGNLVLQRN